MGYSGMPQFGVSNALENSKLEIVEIHVWENILYIINNSPGDFHAFH